VAGISGQERDAAVSGWTERGGSLRAMAGQNEAAPERLHTKMLLILYQDNAENRAKIDAIRAAWKLKTGDQSVLRVTEAADVSF